MFRSALKKKEEERGERRGEEGGGIRVFPRQLQAPAQSICQTTTHRLVKYQLDRFGAGASSIYELHFNEQKKEDEPTKAGLSLGRRFLEVLYAKKKYRWCAQ